MGNHRNGHCQTRINLPSPKVSKAIIVEIHRQLARIEVIQSLNVSYQIQEWKLLLHPTRMLSEVEY
jgi:hypothetical protein